MSNQDHNIDALLRRSVERQLADFEWEGLSRRIDERLTAARAPSRSRSLYGRWVALAAGVALTVGVLIFAVISATGPGPGDSGTGEAKVVMIEDAHPAGTAQVTFERTERPARCEVRILSSDKPRQQDRARASWCIIAKQELSTQGSHNGRDASDVLCLF